MSRPVALESSTDWSPTRISSITCHDTPWSSRMFSSSRSKGDTGLLGTDSFAKSRGKTIASQKQTAPIGRRRERNQANEQLAREAISSSSSGVAGHGRDRRVHRQEEGRVPSDAGLHQ